MPRLRTLVTVAVALLAAMLLMPYRAWAPFAQHTLGFRDFGTQSANTVAAGPTSGGAAIATFRALVAADIPAGAGGPTLPLAINQGGTGQTTAAAGFDALAPTTSQGDLIVRGASSNGRLGVGGTGIYPRSNGTTVVNSSVAAGGAGTCTNQFVRATVDNTTPTCSSVLNTDFGTQTANFGLFGPASGAAATPTFRAAATADIPHSVAAWNYDPSSNAASSTFVQNQNVCGAFIAQGVTGATKIYWGIQSAASTACSVGIYNSAGTKIADSGVKDCSTGMPAAVLATGITAFTTELGSLYYACICNNSAAGTYTASSINTTTGGGLSIGNAGTTKHFGTANACTAGAQPGSITVPITAATVTPPVIYYTSES